MRNRTIAWGVPAALLIACAGGGGTSEPEMLGEARIAIVQVPADVRCASVVVTGNRTVQKSFDLVPGQASTLSLTQLPIGAVTFTASAFDSACSAVTAASVANWLSEPVPTTLASNVASDVTLKLKRNGRANVNLDFDDGPSCGANGVACASNSDCCSAICTAGACSAMAGSGPNCTAATGAVGGRLTQLFTATQPVALKSAPGDSSNVYVAERTGRIRVGTPTGGLTQMFLDITPLVNSNGTEQGLLGLAFHPNYATNGRFFVHYTNAANNVVIAEYKRSAGNPLVADPTATVLLSVAKPQNNHNGGGLDFGKDGFLYIGIGDAGGANDPTGTAQNLNSLLGKVLRIDVATSPYTSPAGNMTGGRPELWDSGLRNPWRFTFDACSGDMYLADEGQNTAEEINVEPTGTGKKNYGWAIMEGAQCVQAGCNQGGLTGPTYAYAAGQAGNCAVIGGYVYRGTAIPGLRGRYIYGDYCSGRIWSVASGGMPQELIVSGQQITSFGQDSKFELYALTQSGGVYRLDP